MILCVGWVLDSGNLGEGSNFGKVGCFCVCFILVILFLFILCVVLSTYAFEYVLVFSLVSYIIANKWNDLCDSVYTFYSEWNVILISGS